MSRDASRRSDDRTPIALRLLLRRARRRRARAAGLRRRGWSGRSRVACPPTGRWRTRCARRGIAARADSPSARCGAGRATPPGIARPGARHPPARSRTFARRLGRPRGDGRGARAPRPLARRPPRPAPLSRALRGAVRAATQPRRRRRRPPRRRSRDELASTATSCTPAWTSTRFTPAPLPDGPPRALVLGALVGGSGRTWRSRSPRRMPELHVTIAGAPLPGDDPSPSSTRRRATSRSPAASTTSASARATHHVLLHCADAEPYGLVLVEALAAGRPVVAPAAAGPLEIVPDGAGRLYPPGDAAAAVAGARASRSRDPEAPAAARRRAEAAFDVRDSVRPPGAARRVGRELRRRHRPAPLARRARARCCRRSHAPQLVVVDVGPDDGGAAARARARRAR